LIDGVVTGITMCAGTPREPAANATPCAWFPAEAAMTPRRRIASSSCAMRLYAPRTLNENTGVRSSRFKSTGRPRRSESTGAGSSGVGSGRISPTRASRARRSSSAGVTSLRRLMAGAVYWIRMRGRALRARCAPRGRELLGHQVVQLEERGDEVVIVVARQRPHRNRERRSDRRVTDGAVDALIGLESRARRLVLEDARELREGPVETILRLALDRHQGPDGSPQALGLIFQGL